MPASYKQYIDWDNDGTFGDPDDDVTSRTLSRFPVTTRVGRNQARRLSPTAVGESQFRLNNIDRVLSSENTGSPLYADLQPGRRTLLQATLSAVDYPILAGYIDDWQSLPDISERSVDMSVLDALGYLREVRVSTSLHSGIRTGTAVGLLLDAAGWPADMRDLDPGASLLQWWWADDAQVLDALLQLQASEGPPALLTCDGEGRIVFRDRHHRLLSSASQTVQATWRSSGAEPRISSPAVVSHGWREVGNVIQFEASVRQRAAVPSVVWSSSERISIPAGGTVTVLARAGGPFLDALVPVAGTDYRTDGAALTVGLSRTSGQSTAISLHSPGGAAVVDGLQLRATALETVSTVSVQAEDTTSIAAYGRRDLPDLPDPVWASPHDAAAIADLILGQRSQRRPQVQVTMVNGNDTRLTQMLSRDLSDRVHVVESHTGLDADCHIEQISHTITQAGREHRTVFGLETIAAPPDPVFRFDAAGAGFDDGQFAPSGFDDPSTMFLFDVSGQGFDDAVFAH